MSERERPIKQYNAVTYLRDFIQTALILTQEEEKILDNLYDKYRGLPVVILEPKPKKQPKPKAKPKPKAHIKYRICLICYEIKEVNEFEGNSTICKECRSLKKMEQERTVKREQIAKVMEEISEQTLKLYLKNWRFKPYEKKVKYNKSYRFEYLYCRDFFNNLYTYLITKNKYTAADNLRDTFAQVGMQLEYLED